VMPGLSTLFLIRLPRRYFVLLRLGLSAGAQSTLDQGGRQNHVSDHNPARRRELAAPGRTSEIQNEKFEPASKKWPAVFRNRHGTGCPGPLPRSAGSVGPDEPGHDG
jgi:hypothetical protein